MGGQVIIARMENIKIITWNCQFGLTSEKAEKLGACTPQADIYFVQETRPSDKLIFGGKTVDLQSWYCDFKDSDWGISIFSNKYKVKRVNEHKGVERFRYVVPYDICNNDGKKIFTAFHVWTKEDDFYKESSYPGYSDIFIDAMLTYKRFISKIFINKPFIALGDFNFGGRKDFYNGKTRDDLDAELNKVCGTTRLPQGEPPLLTYKQNGSEFPNDCCYISKTWKVTDYKTFDYCDSDHRPVFLELAL